MKMLHEYYIMQRFLAKMLLGGLARRSIKVAAFEG
jgi:hypothetical protein